MGRLDRHRRKKKHRKYHHKEQERRPRTADSDPEPSGPPFLRGEEQDTSCTNSCDELTLSLHGSVLTDYQRTVTGHSWTHTANNTSSDAIEVTKKLSCLNFSMLPQDPRPSAEFLGPVAHGSQGERRGAGREVLTDQELFTEMVSAMPLPTLSDRELEGMEGVESYQRQARKRPSRRKFSRRSKKFRYISSRDALPSSRTHRGGVGVVRTSSKETPCSPGVKDNGNKSTISRTRSLRRLRQGHHDDDPLQCCFSDTSVVLEQDTPTFQLGGVAQGMESEEEGVECRFGDTPPGIEETDMEQDTLQSELSETTSDSGCEGDDEESCVEGPAPGGGGATLTSLRGPLFPCPAPTRALLGGSWWGGRGGTTAPDEGRTPGDQKLQQILSGSFPLLTAQGRQKMEQVCGSLVEFKHPTGGRAGLEGRQGSGRKKRRKPRDLTSPLTLKDINEKIASYVQEPCGENIELKFNLVSRALCKTISSLAQVYGLECLIEQKRRLPVASPVLRKTPHTRLASREEIAPILRRHGQQDGVLLDTSTKIDRTNHIARSNRQPTAVGGASQALDERNIGNRMLQGMGWRPGSGLGPEGDGILSPVKAYVRGRHAGLGFN